MCQKQRDAISGDDVIIEDFNFLLQEKINKDVLLFKGEKVNGEIYLAKWINPCAFIRITKVDYDSSSKRLASIRLRA